jgi:hypothetical protein
MLVPRGLAAVMVRPNFGSIFTRSFSHSRIMVDKSRLEFRFDRSRGPVWYHFDTASHSLCLLLEARIFFRVVKM